jgi:hypothetical protein
LCTLTCALSLLRRENGYKELVAQLHDRLHAQKHELDQLRSEVAVTKEREAKFKTYHQMAMDTVAQHEQVMQTQLRSGLAERADLLQQLNAAQLENQVHAMLCSRVQSCRSAYLAVRCRADVHACNAAPASAYHGLSPYRAYACTVAPLGLKQNGELFFAQRLQQRLEAQAVHNQDLSAAAHVRVSLGTCGFVLGRCGWVCADVASSPAQLCARPVPTQM